MLSNQENRGFSSAARVAQLGHAVATIINGALAGGLHGAAIAAVKSFAPQIIKFIACVLILAVLLPFFLFLSLVGPTFQFPSVEDEDVTKMTNQAIYVGSLYDQFSIFTRKEADVIIDRLSAGYDDVVVSENLGNTNNYWLIAISSVLHQQDLFRISEGSVRDLVRTNLNYSYYTETYTVENEDGTETEYTRIYIDIWDIGASALMQKLGFDAFKTEWASFLYDNLRESQTLSPGDPGYDGDMPGVDYGDLTFSDGGREVVYYNQMDKRWCNEPYGKTQTIGYAGCGPTALAIVVSTMTDTIINPKEMADWAYENGYVCEGDGSYRTLIPEGAAAFGLSVTGAGRSDAQQIVDALAAGKLVVAIMGPGHFTTSGHFIVLRGVTADGKLLVADPVSLTKSQKEWDASIVFNEASRSNAAGGPFWIIG